jgi:hypothetical protein
MSSRFAIKNAATMQAFRELVACPLLVARRFTIIVHFWEFMCVFWCQMQMVVKLTPLSTHSYFLLQLSSIYMNVCMVL